MEGPKSRRRLTREESQTLTRERLLVAARDLVAERGVGGASVRDIAEAAGYSQGAFYSNFARKEDILLELISRRTAETLAGLDALLERAKNAPEGAMAAFETWAGELADDPAWSVIELELQLHASRNPGFSRGYEALYARKRQALGRIVVEVFGLFGKAPPVSPETIAMSLIALSHGAAAMRGAEGKDAGTQAMLVYLNCLLGARDQAGPAAVATPSVAKGKQSRRT